MSIHNMDLLHLLLNVFFVFFFLRNITMSMPLPLYLLLILDFIVAIAWMMDVFFLAEKLFILVERTIRIRVESDKECLLDIITGLFK